MSAFRPTLARRGDLGYGLRVSHRHVIGVVGLDGKRAHFVLPKGVSVPGIVSEMVRLVNASSPIAVAGACFPLLRLSEGSGRRCNHWELRCFGAGCNRRDSGWKLGD
jgi:hypothetical protein